MINEEYQLRHLDGCDTKILLRSVFDRTLHPTIKHILLYDILSQYNKIRIEYVTTRCTTWVECLSVSSCVPHYT